MAIHGTCAGIARGNVPDGLPAKCCELEVALHANLVIWKGYDYVKKYMYLSTHGYSSLKTWP